jgi:intracellular septation protein
MLIFYMGRPIIKFLTDFGPLLIFFIVYFKNDQDLKIAIPPFVLSTLIALTIIYILERKIPMVPLTSGVIITLFGGLTLYFDNKIFFYMKPTVVNLIFAGVLFFGKFFTKKTLIKIFFKNTLSLEDQGWEKLNKRWILFFIFVAVLNEVVWRTQSEVFWVNFKVWGLLPISFLFILSQIPLMNKYKLEK